MEITANIPGNGLAHIGTESGQIARVEVVGPVDDRKPYVSPGFIDLQLNGFAGVDFCDANLDPGKAVGILPRVWETGVSTFCPTVITNSHKELVRNFHTLEEARRSNTEFADSVPCYHLEGPYISPGGSRGAHDPKLMRPPDWDEFLVLQRAAGGRIGIITLAPEMPGALEFIRRAHGAGVVVALGHTDAAPEQIHQAVEAGAELSTHLGNGCPQLIDRHQNPLWAQIAIDQLSASLICDSFHLPPDVVRVVLRAKGINRCLLVTDAVHVAGLAPGRYSIVGLEIELLPSGQVVTADRRCMAGSALSMNRAIAVFADYAQVPLDQAVRAATANPARLLYRHKTCAALAEGQPANLTLFRPGVDALQIETVTLHGKVVYSSEWSMSGIQHGSGK